MTEKLTFRYGVMKSGKSRDILSDAFNCEEAGLNFVAIKPSEDTKGDHSIVTRLGGASREVDFLVTPELDVRQEIQNHMARRAIQRLHLVLVDEAQFLEPEQVEQLKEVAVYDNIPVTAYGLLSDFLTKQFPGSQRLIEIADIKEELRPPKCGHDTLCEELPQFNSRQVNGQFVFEGSQVAIDGKDAITYASLCYSHYRTEEKIYKQKRQQQISE